MTYAKITVPNTNPHKQPENINSEPQEKLHMPEIHITSSAEHSGLKKESYNASNIKFLPSVSTVLSIIALCLASFIIGCCATDTRLCNTIVCINTVASGRLPYSDNRSYEPSDQSTTVYQKYMTDTNTDEPPEQGEKTDVQYLAANPSGPDSLNKDASLLSEKKDAVPVESAETGKTGSDGEILYPVIAKSLACTDIHSLSNQTSYKPDTYTLIQSTPPALENLVVEPNKPLVLIVHTHGTECYNSCEKEGFYSTSLPVRSDDITKNVVSMGEKIVSVLDNFGIPALHSTKMCDKESFVKAYSTSYAEVKKYLEEYPSIKFVIDLHRDSIEAADHTKTKPVVEIAGENAAQLMFVVGTNASGNKHPDWKNNLSLALNLQNEISKLYPGLFRRINLRTASFNQQLSDGYLLLECGSCANSYEEAENAAEMFATGFAKVIKKALS